MIASSSARQSEGFIMLIDKLGMLLERFSGEFFFPILGEARRSHRPAKMYKLQLWKIERIYLEHHPRILTRLLLKKSSIWFLVLLRRHQSVNHMWSREVSGYWSLIKDSKISFTEIFFHSLKSFIEHETNYEAHKERTLLFILY